MASTSKSSSASKLSLAQLSLPLPTPKALRSATLALEFVPHVDLHMREELQVTIWLQIGEVDVERKQQVATTSATTSCWSLAASWVLQRASHCLAILQVIILSSRVKNLNALCWAIYSTFFNMTTMKSIEAFALVHIIASSSTHCDDMPCRICNMRPCLYGC